MSQERTSAVLEAEPRAFPLAQALSLFAPISLLCNAAGSLLRYPEIGSAVLFPPYAALTTALLVSAPRNWTWFILVDAVAHLVTHWPRWDLSWVLLAEVANAARALTAAVLLRWLLKGPPRLDSVRALVLFVISAVLIAPAVGATLGAANVVLHGASTKYWHPWSAWFMSNALTGLTILPAFILAAGSPRWRRRRISRRRAVEMLLLAGAVGVTSAVAFLVSSVDRWHPALFLYAPLPALIWAALRFGLGGASLSLTAVTFAAIWAADRGAGPFLAASPDENVLVLQLFVLLTTFPVLCIAAVSNASRGVVHLHHALLASLQDHVAILDGRGIVLGVNASWRRCADTSQVALFHRTRVGDDYVGACRTGAEQGDTTAARVLAGITSVLGRDHRRFEVEYEDSRDGRREWYALGIDALERSAGGAIVTLANVTARRQASIEIEEQRYQLSHLARVAALGQLSGALAHELNQPLASICSNAEAARHLLKRQPADLGEVDAILRDIVSQDQRAAQVIRRLRALLKRGETRLQTVDMTELVNEALELAHGELVARAITATAVVPPDVPPVSGDRVQLQQVLLNLILNSCEAMDSTAPPDRRLFLIVGSDTRNNVQLSIRDCGPGIPPALIDRLFEPFVTSKPEGLGLGLSISRTIVAAHGGRMWAENNAGGGATVHCLLASVPAGSERPPFAPSAAGDRSLVSSRLAEPTPSSPCQ
jgi:two-component system, LuxR family, sensor kinase FixL